MATVELVECLGRKCLLITSALGMGLCVVALTVYHAYWTADHQATVSTEWRLESIIPIVLTTLYACSYSVGWGPVTMLVYTEVVRFDVRITRLTIKNPRSILVAGFITSRGWGIQSRLENLERSS